MSISALAAPGVPVALDGFEYPAPRFPRYLLQERTDDLDELMPLARAHVRRRYGRSALGDVRPGDELLIVTFPHQNELVFEALRRALLEIGVGKVDRIDVSDLGMEVREYSAADGWREVTDRLPPMIEEGVEFNVAAAALKRFLDDRPGYTGVYAGEAGRSHWKRAAGKRIRNNWVYSTYEDFIGRANGMPDEIWRTVDLMVVDAFRNASAVRITSPEGTDIGWEVSEAQADLWARGAYISGHILGSTIQGIRFGHSAETFLREAKQLMPTLNGVVGGTSNHTGYYPHIQVTIESGMITKIDGGGRYGDLWRDVVERYRDVQYPGFPYRGWAYFNDASIGTNPKSYRQIETLWKYNDSWTNLPERAQAGVIHFGFGAEHWDTTFLDYAKRNKLPTMHFPHVHNLFATYEIKQRDTGEWVKLIDKGRITALDHPRVVRLASSLGGTHHLEHDWIPALPGINYPGDYQRDYAQDPVAWIAREQRESSTLPETTAVLTEPAVTDAPPFYLPTGDEIELFRAAYEQRIPVLLKGPTGCGKTRFVEHMAWHIARERTQPVETPLVTVTCHDDMTGSDLVGRYLLSTDGTTWLDGPLTQAVRSGALCYLDEIVEARKDTTVILHSLTDHRRMLPVERLGLTIQAHPDFLLVVSYNPGYQASAKDLKPSTRQRFVAIEFDYPDVELETAVIAHESGIDEDTARQLAFVGDRLRNLDEADIIDGPSTRLLVYVGALIRKGVAPLRACDVALVQAVSDDRDVQDAVRHVVHAVFPE